MILTPPQKIQFHISDFFGFLDHLPILFYQSVWSLSPLLQFSDPSLFTSFVILSLFNSQFSILLFCTSGSMMQFSENPPPLFHQIIPPSSSSSSSSPSLHHPIMNKTQISNRKSSPWPGGFPTSSTKSLSSFGDANCMEQLLVHCANAIESNDATLAQQILWVLNNIAPPDGDSNQRLSSAFLRALIARAVKTGTCKLLAAAAAASQSHLTAVDTHKFSVIELANFVDLTPWHRFGFTAANAAILEAVDGYSSIHIVDLSSTHCMQIPTLIDALANRYESPPLVKLTVAGSNESAAAAVPPRLNLSYQELGTKLISFARSRNIILEFTVIPSSYEDGFSALLDYLIKTQQQQQQEHSNPNQEALVINCHMLLHYIPDELILTNVYSQSSSTSFRTLFLKSVRSLDPTIMILADEDADFTSNNLVSRLRSAFNYLWIPYDTIDTFLGRGSEQRKWYEGDICWKIENLIANEGAARVERVEPKSRWVGRMRDASFKSVGFGEEAVGEVRSMLEEHAAGWGLKKEEDDHLVLTWKGHNVVFATAWIPT